MFADRQIQLSPSSAALGPTNITYEIERQVQLEYGLLEVGKFRWTSPVDFVFRSPEDRVSFNLALSPRPTNGYIAQLGDDGKEHREKLERVMLLDPDCAYRLSLASGNVRSLYCSIDRIALEQLLGEPINTNRENWQAQTKLRMPVIELLLNRIYEELREENFAAERSLEAYAQALCVELARCLQSASSYETAVRKGGLAPWRQRLLDDRIYADAPAPRLPELAQLCSMTVRQLSRAFKEETGKTLGNYIAEATIERAVALLTQSDRPIADISAELGFSTPASFTYAFRRSTGILPRELRVRSAV